MLKIKKKKKKARHFKISGQPGLHRWDPVSAKQKGMYGVGAGEMASQLKTLSSLLEDSGLVLRTHMEAYN